ncbi:type II toxin-antitoxin system HicB family antitoxin [Legionella shakespearei]|uniref:Antitoxin HicB n=1 Tax=Legionella shakespearei DSM 23087 TaxID=1122169 RepID=A0A0W0YM44_9GAMM|nr:type II toxin-antitoxin system HicB family antitoxin [Legionella shakespearei]KTD57796.1 antitoxin HicB [Legionella shakespearei DSM 23087]
MKDILDLTYGAKVEPDGNGFLVTFRDIENAFTYGETLEEAIFNAQEVLDLMLLDRLEKNEEIILPTAFKNGELAIAVSPEVAAPALLHIIREQNNRTMADVARTMGVSYQSYQRLESGKNLTMRSLKKAASALGSIVEIRLRKIVI